MFLEIFAFGNRATQTHVPPEEKNRRKNEGNEIISFIHRFTVTFHYFEDTNQTFSKPLIFLNFYSPSPSLSPGSTPYVKPNERFKETLELPSFINQVENQTVRAGTDVKLICQVQNLGNYQVL